MAHKTIQLTFDLFEGSESEQSTGDRVPGRGSVVLRVSAQHRPEHRQDLQSKAARGEKLVPFINWLKLVCISS
jgi:hypothetical protein